MRSRNVRLTLAGACLMLAGTRLVAQQPGPSGRPMPPHAGMPMMDCPMASAMMRGPDAALRAGTELGLSAVQRTKLEALQRELAAASRPSMDSMQVIHAQLMALAQRPQFDDGAVRAAFDRMGRAHTTMGVAMMRAAHEASATLTPAQRDSLAAIATRQMRTSGPMSMCGMPMHSMPMHPMPGAGRPPKH